MIIITVFTHSNTVVGQHSEFERGYINEISYMTIISVNLSLYCHFPDSFSDNSSVFLGMYSKVTKIRKMPFLHLSDRQQLQGIPVRYPKTSHIANNTSSSKIKYSLIHDAISPWQYLFWCRNMRLSKLRICLSWTQVSWLQRK